MRNFLMCGGIGWCMEIFWTGIHCLPQKDFTLMGYSSIWMFPIYGMASFLAPVCKWVQKRHFLIRGLVYAAFIFTGEFVTGTALGRRDLCPWDYGQSRWNVKKVIRLDYLPCWILAGLLFERLIRENDS